MNTKQKIWKITTKVLIILLWVSVIGSTVFALTLSNAKEQNTTCKNLFISITPADIKFYNKKRILELVGNKFSDEKKLIGTQINQLNFSELETKITKDPFIKNAEIYSDLKGNLNIKIIQRKPLIRIFKFDGMQYYVDKEGIKIPLSDHYTERTMIANGNIFERFEKGDSLYSAVGQQLYKIATHVDNDAFLKAQIEQIFVDGDNEFILVPKVGNHTIILGNADDLDLKFEKLKVFYKKGLNITGWNKYKSINLKYKNQIVCTRK